VLDPAFLPDDAETGDATTQVPAEEHDMQGGDS
jgi:hypothetical protein